jgi:hypothetical protein
MFSYSQEKCSMYDLGVILVDLGFSYFSELKETVVWLCDGCSLGFLIFCFVTEHVYFAFWNIILWTV